MDIVFQSTTQEELVNEYQNMIKEHQELFTKEMIHLQEKGDFENLRKMSETYQQTITDLGEAYQEALKKQDNSEIKLYDQSLCTMDLNLAVYDGDRDYLSEFEKDPDIQKAITTLRKDNPVFDSRKKLLKTSLRVTPILAPALYDLGNKCIEKTGLKKIIEFYIYQGEEFNAACYPPDNDRLYIILSSGLLQKFDEKELAFVIGHEIGHALFGHSRYPARHLMEIGDEYLSPLHAMKLYAWSRCAEISADRIGLLCSGSFDAAARCFFKLSSGITSSAIDFQLKEYIKQFSDLKDILGDNNIDPEDWYSTHPFGPLRIKALQLFKDSKTYSLLNGEKDGKISEAELELQIKNILSLMEPNYLDTQNEHAAMIQEFLFLAGYLITVSDGIVRPEEIQNLSTLVGPEVFAKSMEKVKDFNQDQIIDELKKMGDSMNTLLSVIQKLNILKDLCIISNTDGEIAEAELNNLYGITGLLNIKSGFIDQTIGEFEKTD